MWFPSSTSYAAVGALVAAAGALPQSGGGGSSSSRACNNAASLCGRRYDEVTYLGAHNSYALRDDSTNDSLSGNQYLNATKALDAGLRLLQVQTQPGNATLELCHTSCDLLDAGPLADWLADVNSWLDGHPDEVVTLLVVNGGGAPASEFAAALQSSGIASKAYAAPSTGPASSWPTLRSMIDDDARLVVFVTDVDFSPASPAVLPEFDFVFETPFEVTSLSGFNCTLDRPGSAGDAATAVQSGYLGLVNHFKYQEITAGLQIPDVDTLDTVNGASTDEQGSLGTHLSQCNSQWGTRPSFVLIDFWDEGDPLKAVDRINGVDDATGRVSPDGSDGGSGGDGGSSSARGMGHQRVPVGALLVFVAAAIVFV